MTEDDLLSLDNLSNDDTFNSDILDGIIDLAIETEQEKPLEVKKKEADDFDRLLDDFISSQLQDIEDSQEETQELQKNNKKSIFRPAPEDEFSQNLYPEERRLYDAYNNFKASVCDVAVAANLPEPELSFSAENIYPRFRPKRSKVISEDIVTCWNLLLQAQPIRLSNLPENATDEQFLEFAEKTTDENLQMAVISYVETLIELEGCEIAYNIRKAKAKKRKIEKKIYEDHQKRIETMKRFIEKIEEQKFPINAEKLVSNYFKTARKDPDGAKKILENNPATYAPIDISKLKPRFFGMIKPKPEDGIKINREIGQFLKTLKA